MVKLQRPFRGKIASRLHLIIDLKGESLCIFKPNKKRFVGGTFFELD